MATELSDLILRTGRLAYQNPDWSPATSTGILRDPADLAPAPANIGTVAAAIHHAIDALAGITAEDAEAVRTAAADGRLYLPTRLLPAENDIPRRYTRAPRSRTNATLIHYRNVITADTRAVAALDRLAETLHASSDLLAEARRMSRQPIPMQGSPGSRLLLTEAMTGANDPVRTARKQAECRAPRTEEIYDAARLPISLTPPTRRDRPMRSRRR